MERSPASVLAARLGGAWTLGRCGGGGFCATWRAEPAAAASGSALFVKSAPIAQAPMLQAEADGLAALAAARAIRVPALVGCWGDDAGGQVVLAMEWLELSAHPPARFGERLGHGLAALHLRPGPQGQERFGWWRDNWLGGTPQRNRFSRNAALEGWLEFFAQERLAAMTARLSASGPRPALADAIGRLIERLPGFFDDGHVPRPSLIHGDLWCGNWGSLGDATAVIFDPAVSLSDAEAELAMMELFGAPPPGFWGAYGEVAPVAAGYARRRPLYQLYHLLNHAVLFGGGYERQAMQILQALLRPR